MIDNTRGQVDNKRAERMSMGDFISELGETVIDEEEFGLIKRLQDLKGRYREDFEKWRELKNEIVYCQNLVEQCRQRLVQGKCNILSLSLFNLTKSFANLKNLTLGIMNLIRILVDQRVQLIISQNMALLQSNNT